MAQGLIPRMIKTPQFLIGHPTNSRKWPTTQTGNLHENQNMRVNSL
jgi:hypothetical protein